MPFRIDYSPDAEDHLRALTARQRAVVVDGVDQQLAHEPHVPTRNRKPMRTNPLAPWELRMGKLRVYYDIERAPRRRVVVRAVGVKRGASVRIGGQEIRL